MVDPIEHNHRHRDSLCQADQDERGFKPDWKDRCDATIPAGNVSCHGGHYANAGF